MGSIFLSGSSSLPVSSLVSPSPLFSFYLCNCVAVFFFLTFSRFDSFSVCFTFSLRLPLFISVTHSFLWSLFPCLTQSLSILISLSVYSLTLIFCLSVQIFLFACVLQSIFYLSLSPPIWPTLPVALFCFVALSVYRNLFPSVCFFLLPPSLSLSVLSSHTEYGRKSSLAFSVYHLSSSVYNMIDLKPAPCLHTHTNTHAHTHTCTHSSESTYSTHMYPNTPW